MSIEAFACPKCGADLDLPDNVHVISCSFCGSMLKIDVSRPDRVLTIIDQKLESIIRDAGLTVEVIENINSDLEVAELKKELAWKKRRNQLLREKETASLGCIFSGGVFLLALVGVPVILSVGRNNMEGLILLVFGAIALFTTPYSYKKKKKAQKKIDNWDQHEPL